MVDLFSSLIEEAYDKYQKNVVILIDEYDKPLVDNLTTDIGIEVKEELRNLYSVIKAYDSHIRFVFLTGVSKPSIISIFRGLNNLNDITLDHTYGSLCGYTETELVTEFKLWLDGVELAQIKEWYGGYSWGCEKVYNPYDIVMFLSNHKIYRPYWFELGTPSFLIKLLQERYRYLPGYENYGIIQTELGNFDIKKIKLEALLFQTGYLTIVDIKETGGVGICHLSFPNTEVRSAFSQLMLNNYLLNGSLRLH